MFAQNSSGILFSAHVPSGSHKIAERLPIEIAIENTGKEAIYIYGNLNYLISLFASTTNGKDLAPNAIIETMPPPPVKESFTKVEPGHSLHIVWKENLKSLGIQVPGSYVLKFEYQSNFSPAFSFGLPVWNGSQSTTVTVLVSP